MITNLWIYFYRAMYVSLPSSYIYICMYVHVYVLRLPIIFFDDYPWKTDDYYVYMYIYVRVWWKREWLAIKIVDTTKNRDLISRGQQATDFCLLIKEKKERVKSGLIQTNILHIRLMKAYLNLWYNFLFLI